MKMKRRLALFAFAAVAALAMAACGNRNDTNGVDPSPGGEVTDDREWVQQEGGDLVVAIMTMPASLDLTRNDSASALFARQVYETLVLLTYDETTSDFIPAPNLATEWTVVDPQTVNMTLRQGVQFHNGAPLTAYDVQFSLERAAAGAEASVVVGMIDHVEVHDNYNFTIHLNIPFVPIIEHLGHVIAGIMHRDSFMEFEAAREADPTVVEHPIGTGAFMFQYQVLGDYIQLVRNPNYWGTPAIVDTLRLNLVSDSMVRVVEANRGVDVHIGMDIQPPDVAPAEASDTARTMRRHNLSMNYLGFNMTRAPFDNPLVRQAINYAIDVEEIIDVVFFGLGAPLQGVPLSDVNRDFVPGVVEPFDFNVERARQLMEEAGYADGFSAEIWYNVGNSARQQMAEIVQHMLREINIDLSVQGLDWTVYLDRTGNFEHDMKFLGWVSVVGDLDYALHPLFHSSNLGPAGNRFGVDNPVLDRLLDDARTETDPAARRQLYIEAQQILREEVPMALLNQGEFAIQVHDSIGGFIINPAGHHNFARVYFRALAE